MPDEASRVPVRREVAIEGADDIDAIDAVDAELFPIFEEEGGELIPQLSTKLRDWARRPSETAHAAACMRTLHTLKGGARLAGAMRLGEMAHRLETRIEQLLAHPPVLASDVEQLQSMGDSLAQVFEALRVRDAQAYEAAEAAVVEAAATTPPPVVSPPEPWPQHPNLLAQSRLRWTPLIWPISLRPISPRSPSPGPTSWRSGRSFRRRSLHCPLRQRLARWTFRLSTGPDSFLPGQALGSQSIAHRARRSRPFV